MFLHEINVHPTPTLKPVPSVKVLVSCLVDKAYHRGGDCVVLGGGLL